MEYGKDHLKVRWFSEIPHCTFQCLYPPALECGCAYSDFNCICLAITDLATDADVEACIKSCPVNPDQRWAPSRILDFCDLVGERIQLPEYMNQFAGLHRRAAVEASYTDYGNYYSDYSTVDYYSAYSTVDYYSAYSTVDSQTHTTTLATATSSPPSSPPSSPTSTISGSAPTTIATGSASSGLSTGAKAGIGVAVPVTVILFGLFLFLLLRKQRANGKNSASGTDHGSNIPELSEQNWPKRPLPTSESLPAEADSNALHEPDSTSVFPSKYVTAGTQSPTVYELSGNSAIKYPPMAGSSTRTHSDPMDKQTYSSVGQGISQKAVISNTSASVSETNNSGCFNASLGALIDTGTSSQKPQENFERLPTDLEHADVPLSQLEAEMALITEEKERLQQLQSLAQREAELKRQIMARKSAM